jgi:hypothetical protein
VGLQGPDFDTAQPKTPFSQGKIGRFSQLAFGSAAGMEAALWTGQIFNNRAIFL